MSDMAVKTRKQQKKTEKEIIALLEELGGGMAQATDFYYDGTAIQIPRGMELEKAAKELIREAQAQQEVATYEKLYLYRPWDGAWCTRNALEKAFGTVRLTGKWGFFGQNPPSLRTINSGINETVEVPWGNFEVALIDGVEFESGSYRDEERGLLYRLRATGPKRLEARIHGVFELVKQELETNSLYRGKAFDGQQDPEFVDVWSVDRSKVVYNQEVYDNMLASIWVPLRHSKMVERQMALKRAVLLHGPFGTGKTLGCMITGQEAISNGWTFIQARPGVDSISTVLQTARLYDPCVVFYEDVDAIMEDDRTAITRLLDEFDGIKAKGAKVMIVMTTNYPEQIQAGMIRPGRIDDTIEILDLDQEGVSRMIQLMLPEEQFSPEIDWETVFIASQGYKPAYLHEVAKRVYLHRLARHGEGYEAYPIETNELVSSANSLRSQYNMQQGAKGMPESLQLDVALKNAVTEVVRDNIDSEYLAPNHG